jgi:hypothetical protein
MYYISCVPFCRNTLVMFTDLAVLRSCSCLRRFASSIPFVLVALPCTETYGCVEL